MKRIVRTRIRVIRYCEGEEGGRFRPPLSRYIYARHGTTERHGRDNRPRPFLKAELKSFSTGVQRPLLPRKRKEEKEKRKKTRTVVNATRWPPRLSVNTDANRPAAAPQKFFSASCQPFPSPSHVRRDASRPISTVQFFRPPTTYSTYVLHGRKMSLQYWGAGGRGNSINMFEFSIISESSFN